MKREHVFERLSEAKQATGHVEFVIIGSLSVLGATATPPDQMTMSIDVDLYPAKDPGRASEIADLFGQESAFFRRKGFYADAVSPRLPALPDGWEGRMIALTQHGITARFLEPHDAAVSKYVRGEERDRTWVRAGLAAGILSLATIDYRLRETVLERDERERADTAIADDRAWLTTRREITALVEQVSRIGPGRARSRGLSALIGVTCPRQNSSGARTTPSDTIISMRSSAARSTGS